MPQEQAKALRRRGRDVMIQDIEPHHLDNQYRPLPPDKDSIVLYYEDHAVLMKVSEEGIAFPRFSDLERLNGEIYEESTYLFSVDEERYYLADGISRELLSDFRMENTEIFRRQNRSIMHLPELRDISFITGIRTGNIAADVENG